MDMKQQVLSRLCRMDLGPSGLSDTKSRSIPNYEGFISIKNNIPLSMPTHSNTVHHHVRTEMDEMCAVVVVVINV